MALLLIVCQLGSKLDFVVSGFTISASSSIVKSSSSSALASSIFSESGNLEREILQSYRHSTRITKATTSTTSLQMNKRNNNDYDDEDEDDDYEYAKVRRGKRVYDDEYDGGRTSSSSQRNVNDVGSKRSYRGDYEEEEEWSDEEEWDSDSDSDDEYDSDDDDDDYDDIIPNALLDNIDPDGAVDRLPELFADKQFWKDSTLWFLLAFVWLLGRFNNPMLNGIVDLDKVDFTQFYDKTGM